MAILVTCVCGTSARAPDDAAGKRGKCPKCGAIITVPESGAGGELLRAAPAPTTSKKHESILFTCACGSRCRVGHSAAGRQGKCPACGQVITVPAPGVDPDAALPASSDARIPVKPDALAQRAPSSPPELGIYGVAPEETKARGSICSKCYAEMEVDAILCTNCGYNRKTGQKHALDVSCTESPEESEPSLGGKVAGGAVDLIISALLG
jgi:hypothetical protein